MEMISDPGVTHIELDHLDPSSHYVFKVIAYTAAGEGPPITCRGATLLEGGETAATGSLCSCSHLMCSNCSLPPPAVPPSNVTIVPGNTVFNLSWEPGERDRNHGFHIQYSQLKNSCKNWGKGRGMDQVAIHGTFMCVCSLQLRVYGRSQRWSTPRRVSIR